jgi:hypothetical protein
MHLLRAGVPNGEDRQVSSAGNWPCGFTDASAGWLIGSLRAKLTEWFPRSPIGPARLYAPIVVGLDHTRLIERVEATEAAIHGRLRDLQYDSDHHEERQLIAEAQHTLPLVLRRP